MPTIDSLAEAIGKKYHVPKKEAEEVKKELAEIAAAIMHGSPGTSRQKALRFMQIKLDRMQAAPSQINWQDVISYIRNPDRGMGRDMLASKVIFRMDAEGEAHKQRKLRQVVKKLRRRWDNADN